MKITPKLPLDLPPIHSFDNFDIGKCLDYLRYLQSLEGKTSNSLLVKTYISKIKQRIKTLVKA